jgi:two-component system sensor histidine kinase RstB/two-component system sensor kinase ParS
VGKLFLKLWLFILLTSLTSFLIQRQVFDSTTREAVANAQQERVRRTFVFLEEALRPYPQEEWVSRVDVLQKRIGSPAHLQSLESLRHSGELASGDIERIANGQVHMRNLPDGTGLIMYRSLFDTDQVAILVAPAQPPPLVFGLFRPIVFTWMVESSLYAIVLLLWLRFFWRDLKKVDLAAEQVGAGKFDVNLQMPGSSALRPIADSFNRMAERIGRLVNSHRDLTNAVSHELKTPLARLRFAISLAEDAGTSSEREQLLKKMNQDVDELDALVQEMLLYSRLERNAATPEIALQPVPVESWLPNAVEDEIEAAQASDISIPVAVDASVADAACEPRYMARAVQNLVRNALRFAKSRVEVHVGTRNQRYFIEVDDDGPGIPEGDHSRLFVPFARLDESRTRQANSGGTGLGLAIVQRIAEWHGGRAIISTSSMGGARITIEWPEQQPAATATPA